MNDDGEASGIAKGARRERPRYTRTARPESMFGATIESPRKYERLSVLGEPSGPSDSREVAA